MIASLEFPSAKRFELVADGVTDPIELRQLTVESYLHRSLTVSGGDERKRRA